MSGHRAHVALSAAESAIGVDLWWQLRPHDTWVYRARFIDGDLRAHQFLADEAIGIVEGLQTGRSQLALQTMLLATQARIEGDGGEGVF